MMNHPISIPLLGFVEHEVETWLQGRKALRDLRNPSLLESDRILNADLTRTPAEEDAD